MSGEKKAEKGMEKFDLAVHLAAEMERRKNSLLSGSALAKIDHTPENEATARKQIEFLNQTTGMMLRLSQQERGMYLLWFRNKYGHGEWQKFCAETFPGMDQSTIRRCILAYRIAIGERKPKELTYTAADVADPELAEAACDPDARKINYAPRSVLTGQVNKLHEQLKKGAEQLAARDRRIDELTQAMADLKASLFAPKEVRDEEQRLGLIRQKFGEFLIFWHTNFSHNLEAMRMHKSVLNEFTDRLSSFWEEQMLPHCNAIEQEAREKRQGKRGAEKRPAAE
jgi:hypothetical protein